MKKCNLCQETKPLDAFHKLKKGKHGRHGRCKDCRSLTESDSSKEYYSKNRTTVLSKQKEYRKKNKDRIDAKNKRYREENPDRLLDSRLRHLYNISLEQYNKMLKEQDYVCAICKQDNITGKALSVDHDHKCCPGARSCGDCVRALLCFKCNTTLGHFRDDEDYLQEALNYIKKYRLNIN